ncbi:MAG TPA: GFA family protein [Rhodanobacteraceae bacterium]|nr:GFA family protein [Rhodanobacteraceae bacterium]
MGTPAVHTARCFCGAVEVSLSGAPEAMGYCHCESCRRWSAGPVNAFSLWPNASVRITRGEDQLGSYAKTPASVRRWCKRCGGHVLTEHPAWGLVDVYAAVIEDFDFAPGVHVHYAESVLPIRDGVTKLKDLPEAMGGSGAAMAE